MRLGNLAVQQGELHAVIDVRLPTDRLMEGVLGLAGAGVMEDVLTRTPGVGLLALLLGPPTLPTSGVEQMSEYV